MEPGSESEDEQAIHREVDRFALRSIEPRVARPETPMGPDDLDALIAEARALGIAAGDEPTGLAVWEDAHEGGTVLRSVRVLTRMARANAGVAKAVHDTSLARWLARRIGVTAPQGDGFVALYGRFGLGRGSLARHLAGAPLEDDDLAMLRDLYGPASSRIATTVPSFAWVLAPVWVASDGFDWVLASRDRLDAQARSNAHGFDELLTLSLSLRPGAAIPVGEVSTSRVTFATALELASIGHLAIACGAVQRAYAVARRHAETRRQGGRLIVDHPAVAQLLASQRTALDAVDAMLTACSGDVFARAGLRRAFGARAEAHPMLCRAANDAMQVLGGTGYMRDAGVEKIVRDVNHLRALGGSPPEAALFVAALERVDA